MESLCERFDRQTCTLATVPATVVSATLPKIDIAESPLAAEPPSLEGGCPVPLLVPIPGFVPPGCDSARSARTKPLMTGSDRSFGAVGSSKNFLLYHYRIFLFFMRESMVYQLKPLTTNSNLLAVTTNLRQ